MPNEQWEGLEDFRAEYAFSHTLGNDVYGNPIYDRALDDRDYANATSMILTDGVAANVSDYFKAEPYNGMTIVIKRGFAIVAGTKVWKPTSYYLTLPTSSTLVNQRIVLRYDMRDTVRAPGIFALQGMPTPANNVDMKELVLADVTVRANAVSITAADIKDMRLNKTVCGLMDYIYKIDTQQYFNEFDGVMVDLRNQMNQQQADWNTQTASQQLAWGAQTTKQQSDWLAQYNKQRDDWNIQTEEQQADWGTQTAKQQTDWAAQYNKQQTDFNTAQTARETHYNGWFGSIDAWKGATIADINIMMGFMFDNQIAYPGTIYDCDFSVQGRVTETIKFKTSQKLFASRVTVFNANGSITITLTVYYPETTNIFNKTQNTETFTGNKVQGEVISI